MSLPTIPGWVWVEQAMAALPGSTFWYIAFMMYGGLLVIGGLGLLHEWQRRRTLLSLVANAPGGTVVVQEQGLGGPALWVQVGTGPGHVPPEERR